MIVIEMDTKKILVLGKGQLGTVITDYLRFWDYEVDVFDGRVEDTIIGSDKFTDYLSIDLSDTLSKKLSNCDVAINTIAVTNTRKCRDNWQYSNRINVQFPLQLAKFIDGMMSVKEIDEFKLIHISTGCIFDSNTEPHYENSVPTPRIEYSLQKYQAEAIRSIYNDTVILRPRMIFSDLDRASNMLRKVAEYTELLDEPNSMTCAVDVVNFINICIKEDLRGTFNFCNKGMISPLEIKEMINYRFGDASGVKTIKKNDLHKKLGLTLTDTWIESMSVSKYYDMPDVRKRIEEMFDMADWLADRNENN